RYKIKPDQVWQPDIKEHVRGYWYIDPRKNHRDLKRVFEQYLPPGWNRRKSLRNVLIPSTKLVWNALRSSQRYPYSARHPQPQRLKRHLSSGTAPPFRQPYWVQPLPLLAGL